MKHLELAISFGKADLFENVVEEFDPMLDPILEKALLVEGGSKSAALHRPGHARHDARARGGAGGATLPWVLT